MSVNVNINWRVNAKLYSTTNNVQHRDGYVTVWEDDRLIKAATQYQHDELRFEQKDRKPNNMDHWMWCD